MPRNGRLEYFDDLGHFIHIEQPKMVADMALEFLGLRHSTVTLQHNRIELALHQLRPATGEGRPLLLLHGLGECSPTSVPHDVESWPGSIWGLDFTGHGESTIPVGGGYSAEVLLGDVDAAINHLGTVTLVGRGLGGTLRCSRRRLRRCGAWGGDH